VEDLFYKRQNGIPFMSAFGAMRDMSLEEFGRLTLEQRQVRYVMPKNRKMAKSGWVVKTKEKKK
jgi:hypothetical protein